MIPSLLNPVFSETLLPVFNSELVTLATLDCGRPPHTSSAREASGLLMLIRQRVVGVILTTASVENNEALSLLREFVSFFSFLVHNQSQMSRVCMWTTIKRGGMSLIN